MYDGGALLGGTSHLATRPEKPWCTACAWLASGFPHASFARQFLSVPGGRLCLWKRLGHWQGHERRETLLSRRLPMSWKPLVLSVFVAMVRA
jgi:hypothetical protein